MDCGNDLANQMRSINVGGDVVPDHLVNQMNNMQVDETPMSMTEYSKHMDSDDRKTVLSAVLGVRKLLSREAAPPISEAVKAGTVPKLLRFMNMEGESDLQFESLWALTNILSGDSNHVKVVIEEGAMPYILNLVQHKLQNIRSQALWALGNIAGDCVKTRDFCINNSAPAILASVAGNPENNLEFLRNLSWTSSNLLRGKPAPPLEKVKDLFPIVHSAVNHNDIEVRVDGLWSLGYLSQGTNEAIAVSLQICPDPVCFLRDTGNNKIIVPALRVCGNIATGTDAQTQHILDRDWIAHMKNLLSTNVTPNIMKECVWGLSNVLAGTEAQIQQIINMDLISPLVQLAGGNAPNEEIRRESLWCLANGLTGSSLSQSVHIIKGGALEAMVHSLDVSTQEKVASVCMEGIFHALEKTNCLDVPGELDRSRLFALGLPDILDKTEAKHFGKSSMFESLNNLLERI